MHIAKKLSIAAILLTLACCDGMSRGCSSWVAENTGADWVIAQRKFDGSILHCWKLEDVSVTNEAASDGVYWKGSDGNLIHIAGWYDRVQVSNGHWDQAAQAIGIELKDCK